MIPTDGRVQRPTRTTQKQKQSADYSAATTSWGMYDTARTTYNEDQNPLWANKSINEGYRGDGVNTSPMSQVAIDILSNGFNVRGGGSEINETTNNTYIYAAFAENPFKYARAR